MRSMSTDSPNLRNRPEAWEAGLIAGAALLLFYFTVLTLSESFAHAVQQTLDFAGWVLALAAGFGIQVGLYRHLRLSLAQRREVVGNKSVAASGGVSAVSMVACCAHHLVDVLPILGLSAAALFLSKYQTAFMALGVASNLVGVSIMLELMQRHGILRGGIWMNHDFKNVRRVVTAVAVLIVLIAVGFALRPAPSVGTAQATGATGALSGNAAAGGGNATDQAGRWAAQTSAEAGISITVVPVQFAPGQGSVFSVAINTHTGSLDYDLKMLAVLRDEKGREYKPTAWTGQIGGHHVSGELSFPKIEAAGTYLLIIKNVGVPERIFRWSL